MISTIANLTRQGCLVIFCFLGYFLYESIKSRARLNRYQKYVDKKQINEDKYDEQRTEIKVSGR